MNLLKSFIGKFIVVYLDNIMIYSTTKEDHVQNLRYVISAL